MEHLNGEEKRLLRDNKRVDGGDIEDKSELGPEEQEEQLKTTNGVF